MNWLQAFQRVAGVENAALVVFDVNHVLAGAPIYRGLLDVAGTLKRNGSAIVMIAPGFGSLPPELVHVVPVIRQPLPSRAELLNPLQLIANAAGVQLNGNAAELVNAAAGLTLAEAENAFALSLAERGELAADIVAREKMRTIAGTGFLSVEQPRPLSDIGGLNSLKRYFAEQVAPNFGNPLLSVRGILLAGMPGTGKSLAAKVAPAMLRVPLVRFDISACKGGIVGQSERNVRAATALAEAIAPCVLWIDEIEKALGGFRSSAATDGGTTLSMVGHLLTWLQEHNAPIFTVATCNAFDALPPELTRAGRFDERFYVDLPTATERAAIAGVHVRRFGLPAELADVFAARCDGFTGAELEQAIKNAARVSSSPTAEQLADVIGAVRPVASIDREAANRNREQARRIFRLANDTEQTATGSARRLTVAGGVSVETV